RLHDDNCKENADCEQEAIRDEVVCDPRSGNGCPVHMEGMPEHTAKGEDYEEEKELQSREEDFFHRCRGPYQSIVAYTRCYMRRAPCGQSALAFPSPR